MLKQDHKQTRCPPLSPVLWQFPKSSTATWNKCSTYTHDLPILNCLDLISLLSPGVLWSWVGATYQFVLLTQTVILYRQTVCIKHTWYISTCKHHVPWLADRLPGRRKKNDLVHCIARSQMYKLYKYSTRKCKRNVRTYNQILRFVFFGGTLCVKSRNKNF